MLDALPRYGGSGVDSMTGADAVCALETAGFTVTMDQGRRGPDGAPVDPEPRLKVTGTGSPPADAVAALKRHKADAVAYLQARERQEDALARFGRMFASPAPDRVRRFFGETGRI